MNADQAIKTLEGLIKEYSTKVPIDIKKVEEAISALKDYIHYAEGRMASDKLDVIANDIQAQDPVIAMAIDRISDILDKKASPMIVFHAMKDMWETNNKNKVKFIEALKKEMSDFSRMYSMKEIEKALSHATNGAITIDMIKTSGFLTEH